MSFFLKKEIHFLLLGKMLPRVLLCKPEEGLSGDLGWRGRDANIEYSLSSPEASIIKQKL